MLKTLKSSVKMCYKFQNRVTQKRSFLSEAYRCEETWKARLQSPLLQKYKPEDLFLMLDQKYTSSKKVSALDIDIFANSVTNGEQIQELLILLQNLRRSAETTNTLDSTHHAVVRFLLDNGDTKNLMDILYDRLTYGIIPDNSTYNILMDTYIKMKDYANAAKVAALPMLQEDTENPITNALSVYACFKYLENPQGWEKPSEPVEDSKEEIKVRVAYLRNPYFDDHFNLTDPFDLMGKTLFFQGKAMNNILGRTCQLRGLLLYRKHKTLIKLINQWLDKVGQNIVFEDVFSFIDKDMENLPKQEDTEGMESVMTKINELKEKSLCKDNLMHTLENFVKSAIEEQEDADIKDLVQKHLDWEKQREIILNKQLEEINRLARIEEINKIKKDLAEKESLLTFFENQEKIELQIEKIETEEKEEMERVLQMPRVQKKLRKLEKEQEYIPPKIRTIQ